MKAIKVIALFIVLMSVTLAGCKNAEPKTSVDDSAYPLEDSYPISEYETDLYGDAAYPIYPIDTTQLTKIQNWGLTETRINGEDQTPANKTFSFMTDGRYTLTTDGVSVEGEWTVDTISGIPMLILDGTTDHSQSFEIVNLDAAILTLQFEQDGSLIEELYRPAN